MRPKRILRVILILLGFANQGMMAEGRIVKVLPHFLDTKGKHTLSPSLFERDAYQAHLRKNPDLCSGFRFDVKWSASAAKGETLKLQILAQGSITEEPVVLEKNLEPYKHRGWTGLTLEGQAYKKAGSIVAWKVTLIQGDGVIAEKRSFLWQETGE